MSLGKSTGFVVLSKNAQLGDHIVVVIEEVGDGLEVGVLGEANGIGPHDEGVSVVAIGFGKGPIDGDGVPAFLDRVFAFLDFDGDMAVDDEDVVIHAEGAAHGFTEVGVVNLLEVDVLFLAVGGGVLDKVALEGGHVAFAKERGVTVGPHPVKIVDVIGGHVRAVAVGAAHDLLELVEEFAAAEASVGKLDLAEGAVVVGGDAGVEDEGFIALERHAALTDDEEHVFPEPLAGDEGLAEAIDAEGFLGSEGVGIGRIDGGKVGVGEGVGGAVDLDGSVFVVDAMEHAAVVHLPLGVTFDDGAHELELKDGDGLVHAGDKMVIGESGNALGIEVGGGVVGVDGVGQHREGRKKDAVAFLELPEAEVAQGDAQDGGDEEIGAEGGAHPDDVVVTPGEADLGLVAEVVNDAVATFSAVEEIAGDDDFGDDDIANEAGGFVKGDDVLIVVGEGLDHGIDIARVAFEGDFIEEGDVEDLEFVFNELEEVVFGNGFGERADEAELQSHELLHLAEPPFAILEARLIAAHFFDRVVEEGEEGSLFFFAQFVAEDFVDEIAEAARGIVDDVAELAIVAVDVADDVDASFWQGEFGLKEGNFRHHRGGGRELSREQTQGGTAAQIH